jgi:hypothetical protein
MTTQLRYKASCGGQGDRITAEIAKIGGLTYRQRTEVRQARSRRRPQGH